jgi:hypothetical protein
MDFFILLNPEPMEQVLDRGQVTQDGQWPPQMAGEPFEIVGGDWLKDS